MSNVEKPNDIVDGAAVSAVALPALRVALAPAVERYMKIRTGEKKPLTPAAKPASADSRSYPAVTLLEASLGDEAPVPRGAVGIDTAAGVTALLQPRAMGNAERHEAAPSTQTHRAAVPDPFYVSERTALSPAAEAEAHALAGPSPTGVRASAAWSAAWNAAYHRAIERLWRERSKLVYCACGRRLPR
jgi:hypothetical protein